MAIDRVKKATFLVPRKEVNRLLTRLHALSAVHVEDAAKVFAPPEEARMGKEPASTEKADLNLKRLDIIKSTFGLFVKESKSFIEGFAPLPLQVKRDELHNVVSKFDFEPLYQECASIHEEYRSLQSQIEAAGAEKQALAEFAALPFSTNRALGLQHATAVYGVFHGRSWAAFTADAEARELTAFEAVRAEKKGTRAVVVFLNEDADAARDVLRRHAFAEIALPRLPGTPADRVRELHEDIMERKEQQEAYKARVLELARDSRSVSIAEGHWLSEKTKAEAHSGVLHSRRISVLTGWVRVKDLPKIEKVLSSEFPEASAVYEEPVPGVDNPPVSLTPGAFAKPAQTLINMFGLPDYYSFDPTPWLIFSFLLFFSYCFGDVIYGLGLIALSFVLSRKYRTYPPQLKFFRLFLYAGIGTVIFGAVTGAWAGDLYSPDYLGADNILLKLHDVFFVPALDPLKEPINMLVAALGIGVANQFYGIILHMYKMFRKRKPLDALFDGGLWLVFLPGVLLLVIPVLSQGVPPVLQKVGGVMAAAGVVGLVLTQGRNEKGFMSKAITGVVSLYGVLGSYGATSFMGDVLSYSRLLALGLTTSIVAMTFNIIGGMLQGVPVAGVVLFLVVLAIGHSYNFFVSILTAFVHSARLIFLEFFGRFFEGGARRFTPLSFDSARVMLLDEPSARGKSTSISLAQGVCPGRILG